MACASHDDRDDLRVGLAGDLGDGPVEPEAFGARLDLIGEMKNQSVKLIVVEPYFDLKTPQAIANQVGGKVLILAPSVGGTKEASDYIQLFEYDVNLLASTLKQLTAK